MQILMAGVLSLKVDRALLSNAVQEPRISHHGKPKCPISLNHLRWRLFFPLKTTYNWMESSFSRVCKSDTHSVNSSWFRTLNWDSMHRVWVQGEEDGSQTRGWSFQWSPLRSTCLPPIDVKLSSRPLLLEIREIRLQALRFSEAFIKSDLPPKGFSDTFSRTVLKDVVTSTSELEDLFTSSLLGSWLWSVWLNSLHQVRGCQPYQIFSMWVQRWITTRHKSTFFIYTGLKMCEFIPCSGSVSFHPGSDTPSYHLSFDDEVVLIVCTQAKTNLLILSNQVCTQAA